MTGACCIPCCSHERCNPWCRPCEACACKAGEQTLHTTLVEDVTLTQIFSRLYGRRSPAAPPWRVHTLPPPRWLRQEEHLRSRSVAADPLNCFRPIRALARLLQTCAGCSGQLQPSVFAAGIASPRQRRTVDVQTSQGAPQLIVQNSGSGEVGTTVAAECRQQPPQRCVGVPLSHRNLP